MTDIPAPNPEHTQVEGPNAQIDDEMPSIPLPLSIQVGWAETGGGEQYVVVRLTTPAGMNVYYFPPKMAIDVANQMKAAGSKLMMGSRQLVVPPKPGLVVPGQ